MKFNGTVRQYSEGEIRMEEEKTLICHTNLFNGYETVLTTGKKYPVIEERDDDYVIIDDSESRHYFSKHKDSDGESYKMWLKLVK
jgi:uncharacterized membrane protein